MLNLELTSNKINREQLLVLNTLVQELPFEKRLNYLKKLGKIYDIICNPEYYVIDERDYNIYSIVQIGEQRWLGENLRYKGVRHHENPNNPNLFYGCLYDWAAMMNIDEKYNTELWGVEIDGHHQGIAPKGWHIPSDEEWNSLEIELGIPEDLVAKLGARHNHGNYLKSTIGWDEEGNGIDSLSFCALPAGYHNIYPEAYHALAFCSTFRSAKEYDTKFARILLLISYSDCISRHRDIKLRGFACRCIQDK